MSRLWRRVLASGTAGPMATLEAVLERLWRSHVAPRDHPRLAKALVRIETALRDANSPPALQYRLNNLMHQVANQMGDLSTAERVMAAQSTLVTTVVADPGLFHLLLDAQVFRVLTEELRLDFAAALRNARDHLRLTEQYGTVWELLEDAPGMAGFGRSRLWLKARMTLARALLLMGEPERLVEAGTLLNGIDPEGLTDSDQSRLLGYRVWHAVREVRPADALALAETLVERHNDPFASHYAARAAADAAVLSTGERNAVLTRMLRQLRARGEQVASHPGELLWRDIGLLEHRIAGRQRAAREAFARSLQIGGTLPDSPINNWNRLVIQVHAAILCRQAAPERALVPAVLRLQRQACLMADECDPLLAYRRVSPY